VASSQRYSNFLMPRGRPRAREQPNSSSNKNGSYLPADVMSLEHGSLGDPYTKINAILHDGDEIEVALQTEVEVDDVGAPIVSQWYEAAFCRGEASQRRFRGAALREERRQKELREAALRETENNNGAPGLQFGFQTQVHVLSNTLGEDWEIEGALTSDWDRQVGAAVGEVVDDQIDSETCQEIRGLLHLALPFLHTQFINYSGLFESGPLSGAGSDDVGHFLHGAGVVDLQHHTTAVQEIYERVSPGAEPVDRAGFIDVLLRVIHALKDSPTPILEYLEEQLTSLVAYVQNRSADPIREILETQEMRHFLEQIRPELMDILHAYGDKQSSTQSRPLLSLDAFSIMATNAFGSLKPNASSIEEKVMQAFSDAQPGTKDVPYLVSAEVIEAIARLSMELSEEDRTAKQRIQQGFDLVLLIAGSSRK